METKPTDEARPLAYQMALLAKFAPQPPRRSLWARLISWIRRMR